MLGAKRPALVTTLARQAFCLLRIRLADLVCHPGVSVAAPLAFSGRKVPFHLLLNGVVEGSSLWSAHRKPSAPTFSHRS